MKVSISRIKAFKSCRRLFELKYIEGLEPVHTADALQIGKRYHKLLEELYTTGSLPEGEYTKEMAMAQAYCKYIYPHFHVVAAEKHLEKDLGNGDILQGFVDAIADDGHIVEHKTTSAEITEQYEYNLQWDEQILAYMLLTGTRKVWYTVCRKPTIRQKQNESDVDFYNRMVAWYDEDTESKIRLLEIERTDADVFEFEGELYKIVHMMNNANNYYRNTCHCNQYGRRCEYSSVCLHYDPEQEYIDFTKEDNRNGNEANRDEGSALYGPVVL